MAGRGTDIKLGAGVIRIGDEGAAHLAAVAAGKAKGSSPVVVHELSADDLVKVRRHLEEAGVVPQVVASEGEKDRILSGEQSPERNPVLIPKMYGSLTDIKHAAPGMIHIKGRDYAGGGLHILGTERHESRRIDRQLRGRAGRQGDPGSSRFYLSLEDDLMRLFAPERIISVMDRLGVEEGEVISHPMVTRSIGRAQKRVEMRNFEIRKHLLEYDDVMNKQREVIYKRRLRALSGENLHSDILDMMDVFIEDMVENSTRGDYSDTWDWDGMAEVLLRTMLLPLPVDAGARDAVQKEDLVSSLQNAARDSYEHKRRLLGDDLMGQLERFATLKTIDHQWKEHLYEMDQLKEGIGLRAYGQKDPLLEYKQEGFRAFVEMLDRINGEILEICFKAQLQVQAPEDMRVRSRQPMEMSAVHDSASGMGFAGQQEDGQESPVPQRRVTVQPVKVEHKVGRNEPCPCGSGKKYKQCCGR